MHNFPPWMTLPCNLERRVCPLKMVLIGFVSCVILASLPKANGKGRGLSVLPWVLLIFSERLQVPMGAPSACGVVQNRPPGDRIASGAILHGRC